MTLPRDKEFFQKIRNKTLYETILPEDDYSEYNFKDVLLDGTVFSKYSKLPKYRDFFRDFNCSMRHVVFPKGDYRIYDLKGVNIAEAIFTYDSIMPEYSDFLLDINDSYVFGLRIGYGRDYFNLTKNMARNVHNYNLQGVERIDLTHNIDMLSDEQLAIIRVKYKDLIGKTILLPERGLFKENSRVFKKDIELTI